MVHQFHQGKAAPSCMTGESQSRIQESIHQVSQQIYPLLNPEKIENKTNNCLFLVLINVIIFHICHNNSNRQPRASQKEDAGIDNVFQNKQMTVKSSVKNIF